MSRSAFKHLRLLGPMTVAATLTLGALPTLAQTAPTATTTSPTSAAVDCSAIHFELANPSPGSRVEVGDYVLQGIADDSRAQQGTGIDRIDFFLDNRDQGGLSIGSAVPGKVPGPFGPNSFQTTLSLPNMVGGHDLFAYAYSSVTGQESIISVPIALGEDVSKAAEVANASATETCVGGTTTTTTGAAAPTTTVPVMPPATQPGQPAAPTTTTTTTSPVSASTVTFDVANPSPGDTIKVGGYVIEGVAVDRSATSGTGIDRIDVFLDNRDTGGTIVGEATFSSSGSGTTWHATLNLPANQTGLHDLFFYVRSAVSGMEIVHSVPVTVAP